MTDRVPFCFASATGTPAPPASGDRLVDLSGNVLAGGGVGATRSEVLEIGANLTSFSRTTIGGVNIAGDTDRIYVFDCFLLGDGTNNWTLGLQPNGDTTTNTYLEYQDGAGPSTRSSRSFIPLGRTLSTSGGNSAYFRSIFWAENNGVHRPIHGNGVTVNENTSALMVILNGSWPVTTGEVTSFTFGAFDTAAGTSITSGIKSGSRIIISTIEANSLTVTSITS